MWKWKRNQTSKGTSLRNLDDLLALLTSRRGIVGVALLIAGVTYWWTSAALTAMQAVGIKGSPWVLVALVFLGILLGVIIHLVLQLWVVTREAAKMSSALERANQQACSIRTISRSDESKLGEFLSKAKHVTILSSRSSTYFTQFNRVLRRIERTTSLEVSILARRDGTRERDILLDNVYSQWKSLMKDLPFKLSIEMLVSKDWPMMFRGLIFDDREALLGFYVREGELTRGTEEDLLYVNSGGNDAERHLLHVALMVAKIMLNSSNQL